MDLQAKANELRKDIIKMIYSAQSGHPGGSLSVIDILTTIYFDGFLNYDSQNPEDENRDYCILSKGHAAPALYAVLSEAGFFSKDEFFNLRQVDSLLQWHPTRTVPGYDVSQGSLGQGLSIANGIALAKRDKKVFCVMWDGELQEWQIWEAVMSSSHFGLDNLVAIVDKNNLQIDGETKNIMNVGNIIKKFQAFDWETIEIDGHNFDDIKNALKKAIAVKGKPCVIVANTIKGKGVSFMENNAWWHGKAPNEDEYNQIMNNEL